MTRENVPGGVGWPGAPDRDDEAPSHVEAVAEHLVHAALEAMALGSATIAVWLDPDRRALASPGEQVGVWHRVRRRDGATTYERGSLVQPPSPAFASECERAGSVGDDADGGAESADGGARAYVCLPLRAASSPRPVGTLVLSRAWPLDERDLSVARALAQRAAGAIAWARHAAAYDRRLRADAADRTRRLHTALRVSAAVNAAADLDSMLLGLLQEAALIAGCRTGTVAIVDEDRAYIRGRVGLNRPPEFVESIVRRLEPAPDPEENVLSVVVRTGEQALVPSDHAQVHPSMLDAYHLRGVRFLLTPIRHAGEVIGVLALDWENGARPSAYDEAILRLVAEQAGGAVARARLIGAERAQRDAMRAAAKALARHAERAETSRIRTRAVLDATVDAMIMVARDGRVLLTNRRFEEVLGVPAVRAADRPLFDLRPELERTFGTSPVIDATARMCEGSERSVTTDVTQYWPERRDLELCSTAVTGFDGAYVGRLFVFRDVTRERGADRAKSEFISLVSHELRTPLTSIKGYLELVLAGEVGALTDDQRQFLDVVRTNANRLEAIVGDLLYISRIEAGKIELNRGRVDLAAVISASVAAFLPQVEAKSQLLLTAVPSGLPAAYADPDRVGQILSNLISNAHKYTPAGGRIAVSVAHEGACLRVGVQDSGIGLSPQEVSQLFTKFFRARNRATQEVGGTGLGLVITRSLVELHGGEIAVASAPGSGSTFTFTVPALAELHAEGAPVEAVA